MRKFVSDYEYCIVMEFYKYEGAGNDFIIIDDRNLSFPETDFSLVNRLCDRHFGIGADGLMLLQLHDEYDFKMVYYNSDGNYSSMCGNGGRCITQFAHGLGLFDKKCRFLAVDGAHEAEVIKEGFVSLQMINVNSVEVINENEVLLDTGSPHFVRRVKNLADLDIVNEGRKVRYSERFSEKGVNVNFVEFNADGLHIRTYERGVENETLACGTGVTAAAIAASIWGKKQNSIDIKAVGGDLNVTFEKNNGAFTNIWKSGPATYVYKGSIDI